MVDPDTQRTTASGIIYWIFCAGLIAVLLWSVWLSTLQYNLFSARSGVYDGQVNLFVLWNSIQLPLYLTVILGAYVLRSGAVVWLFGIVAVSTFTPYWITLFNFDLVSNPVNWVAALFSIIVIVLNAVVFWYLIRRGEIRRP